MGEIDTKCKIKLKHTLKRFPSSVELHSLMKSRPGKKALAPAAFTRANPAAPFSWDVSALGPSRARASACARLLPKPWFPLQGKGKTSRAYKELHSFMSNLQKGVIL